MKRMVLPVVAAVFVSGCVTTQRVPPATVVSTLRTFVVVPIEAPPLLVHPKTDADRAAMSTAGLTSPGNTGGGAAFVPILSPNPVANAVFATIGLLSVIGSSTPSKGDSLILTKEPPAPWMPTASLAVTAAHSLQTPNQRSASVIEGYAQLPIVDRSVNNLMENWYAPVRRWYNADVSTLDYTQASTAQADAVLEVGVINYEYASNRLLLQVMIKLVDPKTQKVIARAREFTMPKGKDLAEMLQNQGQPLRDMVFPAADAMLTKCLQDIALIPR